MSSTTDSNRLQENEYGNIEPSMVVSEGKVLSQYELNQRNQKIGILTASIFMILYLSKTGYHASIYLKKNPGALYEAIQYGLNPMQWQFGFSLVGISVALFIILSCYVFLVFSKAGKKNYRPNEEHGSAKLGDVSKDASKLNALFNPKQEKRDDSANMILSKNIQIDLDTRHTMLGNNNVFVVGGSGSGKTRFCVKPNILQMHCNYIVIDPKGSVALETGKAFREAGYEIRYLNTVKMEESMGYNPFDYFYDPNDVQKFVNNLIENTTGSNATGGDDFFVKAEQTWITAAVFYVMGVCGNSREERNFNTVMVLLNNSEADEENKKVSVTDTLFAELEKSLKYLDDGSLEHYYRELAVKNYKVFKMAAGKTAQSILISVGVRLQKFNLPSMQRLMQKDELHLDHIGNPMVKQTKNPDNLGYDMDRESYIRYTSQGAFEKAKIKDLKLYIDKEEYEIDCGKDTYDKATIDELRAYINKDEYEQWYGKRKYESLNKDSLRKTILFIIVSDSDGTFSFITSIILQQLYDMLYLSADRREDNRLPIHTRFINDEFANCGKQPDYERKISTMRSREISTMVILQGISQIKSLYKDDWEAIYENCDITLFLGSKGPTTTEEISKLAGEETVHYKNESISKGRNGSNSTSDQISQRRLFTPDELSRLDLDKCIVHVKGYNIFMDQKYDVLDHKNVNKTKDGKDGELNTFIPRVYRKVIGKYDETRDQIKRWVIHEEEEDPNRKMAEAIQAGESIGNLDPKQIEDFYTSSDNIASYMQFLHTETEYLDLGEMDML